jgi:excisionase family DNA binding protein
MEKICIVKLRKKMGSTAPPPDGFGQAFPSAEDENPPGPRGGEDATDGGAGPQDASPRTFCLTLTPEQTRSLRSEPRLISSLGDRPADRLQAARSPDEKLIIQLKFESVAPLRLLKIDEVVEMLRIGRGYVHKLIREGKLKGYRFGRLRRVLLDDVLSYLEGNREGRRSPPADPPAQIDAQATGRHDLFERR